MTGVPFYFDVRQTSVGWAMSQLSQAAEVVWLLELTATIRPNSAVMSVAEEAGITRFKALLQKKKKKKKMSSFLCVQFEGEPDLFSRAQSPHRVIVPSPKVCVVVKTWWLMNQAAPTRVTLEARLGKKKLTGGAFVHVCGRGCCLACMDTHESDLFFFFFFHDAISGLIH